MKRVLLVIVALTVVGGLATYKSTGAQQTEGAAAPIFGITIVPGYRDWKLISVAHEEGNLNDIRAILGNEKAIETYRGGKSSFPDGTVIARLAWTYSPSPENNKAFGRDQSFVAGTATEWYLQFMVKDSRKYAATGGWGYAQFDKNGNPANAAKHETCFPCHAPAKERDYVFTHYAP